MQIFRISTLILFFSIVANANIVEHVEFASILNYIQQEDYHKNTIVILDIDNTIATLHQPFQWLGGDAWVSYEFTRLTKVGLSFNEAREQILPLYFELTHIIDLKPVESSTPEVIKQLQDSGVTVLACTLRGIEIADRTIIQLKAIGIDLGHSAFGYEELLAHDESFKYKDGIIFCCGGDKGIALKHVLNHFEHTPTKVIMIDDKEKYLHQIKQVLHPDTAFIGIRYGHLDEKVSQYDPVLAEQEKQTYLVKV